MQRAETLRLPSGRANGERGLLEAMSAESFVGLVDVNLRIRAD